MKSTKLIILKILKERKILWGFVGLVLSVVMERFIDYVLPGDRTLCFNLTALIPNKSQDGSVVVNEYPTMPIPLWAILLMVFVIYLLVIVTIKYRQIMMSIKKEKIESSDNENNVDENIIDSIVVEMKKNRHYYAELGKLVENKSVLMSIQKYECVLPDPDTIPEGETAYVKLKRVGGYSRNGFVTNCVLFDQFECPRDVYKRTYDILESSRKFELLFDKHEDYNHSDMDELLNSITTFIEDIQLDYLAGLSGIEDIKPEHYFYYGVLMLLCELGYNYTIKELTCMNTCEIDISSSDELLAQFTQFDHPLLDNDKIETILSKGKRTGLLGAVLLNRVHLFGNEHSISKSDRTYFAAPLKNHSNQFFVFTYNRNLLGITNDKSEYTRCDELFNEISPLLGG